MVKVQVDLSEKENKIVEVFKATHGLITKQEAIKKIIRVSENDKKSKG